MRARTLLMSTLLLPLTACFEILIPGEPEPAELQAGEWMFEMEIVSTNGACADMGIEAESGSGSGFDTWAFIQTHGDSEVDIDLDGFLLEGRVDGELLQADGELGTSSGHPDPDIDEEVEQEDGDEDAGEPGSDCASSTSADSPAVDCADRDEDMEVTPICEDIEPEPQDDRIVASLEAEILRADRMTGSIFLDYILDDTACTVEFAFDAEALAEDPCLCCGDEDVPLEATTGCGEVSKGSEGGASE